MGGKIAESKVGPISNEPCVQLSLPGNKTSAAPLFVHFAIT
jgi:hypothetical protein